MLVDSRIGGFIDADPDTEKLVVTSGPLCFVVSFSSSCVCPERLSMNGPYTLRR